MKFAFVIIETDASRASIEADRVSHRSGIESWMRDAAGRGVLVGGEAFETEAAAPVTIRRDPENRAVVTDGPFAGPAETLGGYILVDVPDRDAAVELALTWPATGEAIEIRPLWVA